MYTELCYMPIVRDYSLSREIFVPFLVYMGKGTFVRHIATLYHRVSSIHAEIFSKY